MVNYGVAFKLPFTSIGRSAALFFLAAVATLANASYSIISELLKNDAGQYSVQAILLNLSVALISFVVCLFFSIVISGYSIRIAASAVRGKNEVPPFDNVPGLIGSGFKYTVALLVYTLPVLLFIVLIIAAVAADSPVLLIFAVIVGAILMILWLIFLVYCSYMLQAHFAHENRFGALFELGKILKYSFTIAYFVPWLAGLGYSIGVGIPYITIYFIIVVMTELLVISPFAMLFLVPFAALYTVILTPTAASLCGQAYGDIIGRKAAPVTAPPARVKPKSVNRGRKK